MQLYRAYRDNGAIEPWLMENEWCFDIYLCWWQWMVGVSRFNDYAGVVWTMNIGPISFTYYHQH